ncbi:Nicotine blue oxidoreductase [Methylobacterium crusticola]|uniref:Nicotine blue oxidoreductase n=1 Tax=Methylobacterium crusticola TaxID=1697972 RepID=A0ABQ4R263_9HYPH|nr:nucleotidyltransferase family protein [Methylobacterium crusticola]GJD50959.1 Nicotine blue oxidoreductase [Methylobacterium crusticola]
MPEAPVGLVLLAAGRGTRFGPEPKLLARLDGEPLVRHAAAAALAATTLASGLGPVVAVLGHAEPEVRAALRGLPLTLVRNPAYADGMATSLRAGLAALPDAVEGAIVLLGDMPRIGAGLLVRLAGAFREAAAGGAPAPAAVVPVRAGRRGNPVLLNRRLLADGLSSLAGDRGAGPLLAARSDVLEVPVEEAGILLDVDTPAALAGLGGTAR